MARSDAGTTLLWCLAGCAGGAALVWSLTSVALSGRAATLFACVIDLGLGAGIGVLNDTQVMFAACILFVLTSAFVTIHAPPAGLVAHLVFVSAFTISIGILMLVRDDTPPGLAVMGVSVWMWVIVGAPLTVRRIWIGISATAELASHDSLTGLLNRAGLAHAYTDLTSMDKKPDEAMMVVAIDIDDFKAVNDRYGHGIGDAVIVETAHHLSHHFGRAAAVARTGGEEYTVIIIGERRWVTRHIMATPTRTPGIHGPAVTISVGAAHCAYRNQPGALRHAMADADHAMYTAKRLGGNRIHLAT